MLVENPLTAKVRQLDREGVADLFAIPEVAPGGPYLLLRRYLSEAPERFFSRDVQHEYHSWLQSRHVIDPQSLRGYLTDNMAEIDRALLFMREVNTEGWHDGAVRTSDDWEFLRFIDTKVHRVYLRLVEGVMTPLARLVAYFCRSDRNAGTEGLDTYGVVQELANTPLALLARSYEHTVRNGIGHGGITYHQNDITYRDKRGNEVTLPATDVVRLCDDLIDDCNGMAAALASFVSQHSYPIPETLLVHELAEETLLPWWRVEGAIRSQTAAGRQLIVFARAGRQEFRKIQFSALQTGILAEELVPGYNWYFISIRGEKGIGWAALDGDRLNAHRLTSAQIEEYGDALEFTYYSDVCRWPRWYSRLDSIVQGLKINWPATRREWHAARGIPDIRAREARMHRNGWRSVLNGSAVVERAAPEAIRKNRRRIVQRALEIATAESWWARILPLGFAQIAVFCRDYRARRLSGFGLSGDLVCTFRYNRIGRIRSPDIIGSTVEILGPWRIAWNRAWLDRERVELDTRPPWRRR